MKKRMLALFFASACLLGLTGCDEPTVYTVEKRDFYYSFDNGSTYGNERFELEVGKTILMKVLITITTNKAAKEDITGSLMIPNIKAIDAYYVRGQRITPTQDLIANTTTYPFTINTNEDWQFIFEFSPVSEARVQMVLDFNEPIPDKYDGIYTIKFVNPTNSETETSSSANSSETGTDN